MRRRRLGSLALAVIVTVITACDNDDGREMQTPDSYARFQLENTTTTTSTTVAPPPTEFIPLTTSMATSSSSSPASTSAIGAPGSTGTTFAGPVAAPLPFSGPWDDGAAIPTEYTCDGAGDAPLITWTAPPEGTIELALSVVDPDANGFVHWLVIGLPAQAGSVGGGEPLVAGAAEAANSFESTGWGGPCPLPGSGPHTYRFTLHNLDQATELPADSPTADLLAAVDAATASSLAFTGTYERA